MTASTTSPAPRVVAREPCTSGQEIATTPAKPTSNPRVWVRPSGRRSSSTAQAAPNSGTAPLSIPATDESIHCWAIGNSSSGRPAQMIPSSATRGRSAWSTGRCAAGNSASVATPNARRARATTPGRRVSRPMSMNRNDDPQMRAMPDSSSHSWAPNASVRLPLPASSSRLLMRHGGRRHRPGELVEVRQVVTGDLADGQVELLLALLAVDAQPPPAVVVDPVQHRQVHRPQPLQRRQELGGGRARQPRPALLVVAGVGGPVLGEDQPPAEAVDHVDVQQVADDLEGGPLPTGHGRAPLGVGELPAHGPDGRGRLAQDLQRLPVAQGGHQGPDVGGRLQGGVRDLDRLGHVAASGTVGTPSAPSWRSDDRASVVVVLATPGTARMRSIRSWSARGLAARALTSRHHSPVTRWHSSTRAPSSPRPRITGPTGAQLGPPVRTQTNAVRGRPSAAQSSSAR